MQRTSDPGHRAVRLVVGCALLLSSACQKSGQLTVVLDPRSTSDALEIILVPLDPAKLAPAKSANVTAAQADSLRLLTTLSDSAGELDSQFRRLRDELNAEATALASVDRRSKEYAARFDEFRPRSAAAEALRASRDKLRARAAALRTALAPLLPDSARIQAAAREARKVIEGAHGNGASTRVVPLKGTMVVVRLQPGPWWIGAARAGTLPQQFRHVVIAAGVRDTARLRWTETVTGQSPGYQVYHR